MQSECYGALVRASPCFTWNLLICTNAFAQVLLISAQMHKCLTLDSCTNGGYNALGVTPLCEQGVW